MCVCVDKIFENHDFPKNLFRQKKLSQKKFWRKKNVRDFFSNFKIKNIFKILENIFWIFHFLKNNDFTF
jgi:hypothetical protein